MRACLALLAAVGCGSYDVDSRSEAIVGGAPTTTEASVALLFHGEDLASATPGCSANLISPRVLVAAAHCMSPQWVRFVDTYDNNTHMTTGDRGSVRIVEHMVDPDYAQALLDGQDFQLMLLERPAPAPSLPYSTAPITVAQLGQPVELVGYGRTVAADPAVVRTRRTGSTVLSSFDEPILYFDFEPDRIGACAGDSGGAALMTLGGVKTLVGVIAFADTACNTLSGATRIDKHAADIQAFLAKEDTPAGCGFDATCATGCLHPDPDCPCGADGKCTDACVDPDTDPDCPTGCGPGDGCEEDCPFRDPDCPVPIVACTGQEACEADEICFLPTAPATGYCTTICVLGDGSECPTGRSCEDGACLVPEEGGGGCSVGGRASPSPLFGLALLALFAWRRRRIARSR